MPTYSNTLDLLYQITNENPNTWGDVLNAQQQLLETAFDTCTVNVQSVTTYTLDDARGADGAASEHYRYGILNITGNPGAACTVNLPVGITSTAFLKKAWLVIDNTTGGFTITFKTSSGAGVDLIAGTPTWCYCDGTDIINASSYATNAGNATTATTATNATLATDSNQLGGVAAANYAQTATLLDTRNTWTKGQVVQAGTLTESPVNTITPDLSVSNSFYVEWAGNWQLAAPQNAVNGDSFSMFVEQAAGGSHLISFAGSTYRFEGGVTPVLSTAAGEVDYLSFQYNTSIPAPNWLCVFIKDIS